MEIRSKSADGDTHYFLQNEDGRRTNLKEEV